MINKIKGTRRREKPLKNNQNFAHDRKTTNIFKKKQPNFTKSTLMCRKVQYLEVFLTVFTLNITTQSQIILKPTVEINVGHTKIFQGRGIESRTFVRQSGTVEPVISA